MEKQLLKKISDIARIKINESEKVIFLNKINNFIDWTNEINTIDTSGVEPTYNILEWQGYPNTNLREDIATTQNNCEKLLQNSPDQEDDFIAVPKIIE